jgi:hypothetical protein
MLKCGGGGRREYLGTNKVGFFPPFLMLGIKPTVPYLKTKRTAHTRQVKYA